MILLYPLRLVPLLLTLTTSFLIWMFFRDFYSFLVLLECFPLVLTVLVYFKYLFAMLEHTANGYSGLPVLTFEFYRPFNEMRPYQLFLLLLFVASLAVKLWQWQLGYLTIALAAYSLCVLPAFIGLLGLHNGFYPSLHPLILMRFMQRIGIAYPAMLAMLAAGIGYIVFSFKSGPVLFSAIFITLYGVVLMFLLLGKIIYSKRESLDYRPNKSPEREAEKAAEELLAFRKQRVTRIFKERRRENILAILLAHIEAEEDKLAAHAWYHSELMRWDSKRLALKHGKFYVQALRNEGKDVIAELIHKECQDIDPDFSVE